MRLPTGIDGLVRGSAPWATLAISATTLLALICLPPAEGDLRADISPQGAAGLVEVWVAHPELRTPPRCAWLLRPHGHARKTRALAWLARPEGMPLPRADAQVKLDTSCAALLSGRGSAWLSLALVPARGWLQPGLLTHAALHTGWLHLGLLLAVLWLCGAPALEALWRPEAVGALFAVGASLAAAVQIAVAPSESLPVAGAAGGIAALQGAFTVRLDGRQARLALPGGRTLRGPSWTLSALWLMGELLALGPVPAAAPAVLAGHVAAFALGVGVAAAARRSIAVGRWLERVPQSAGRPAAAPAGRAFPPADAPPEARGGDTPGRSPAKARSEVGARPPSDPWPAAETGHDEDTRPTLPIAPPAPDRPPPAALQRPPRLRTTRCRLLGWTPDGLLLESEGGRQFNVEPASIRAMAVGMILGYPDPGGRPRPMAVADLVVEAGQRGRQMSLRCPVAATNLRALMPSTSDRRLAWAQLLRSLAQRSGAQTMPEMPNWPGPPMPEYEDEAHFEREVYEDTRG